MTNPETVLSGDRTPPSEAELLEALNDGAYFLDQTGDPNDAQKRDALNWLYATLPALLADRARVDWLAETLDGRGLIGTLEFFSQPRDERNDENRARLRAAIDFRAENPKGINPAEKKPIAGMNQHFHAARSRRAPGASGSGT